MSTQYKKEYDGSVSITVNLKPTGNFLEQEEQITEVASALALLARELTMLDYDTDGSPLVLNNEKYVCKGQKKKYQTPWGQVELNRHVYQSSRGGKTFVPLEASCSLVTT